MAVTEAQHPPLGTLLHGRYVVNQLVARSAMARVYAGRRPCDGKAVAIKVSGLDVVRSAGLLAPARWARLSHPHVVRIHEFLDFPEWNLHCCIMDLLKGEGLDLFLYNRQAELTVGAFLEVLRRAASGVDALHAARILHLDIKPSNIIAGPSPRDVQIVDAGIALAMESASTPAAECVPGTPHYMAPERVIGASFGPRADVYSLAAVIYELLCGQPLFEPAAAREIAFAQMHATPVCLRRRNPRLPATAADAVHRSLEKKAELRHASAGELVEDIARGMISREEDPLDTILGENVPLAGVIEA